MSSAQGIRAGRAYIELFADGSKLQRGLDQASKDLKAFGAGITAVGAGLLAAGGAAVAGFAAALKTFGDAGTEMADLSARTGVSVESLSSLGYAADATGASVEDVSTGLKHMSRAITEAASGSKEAQAHLASLGLTAAELQALAPDQAFRLLGQRLAAVQDPAQRATLAMGLFGREAVKLLPLFAAGVDGLEAKARELGVVMSSADAQAGKEFGQSLKDLWAVVKVGIFQVGGALAPELKSLVKWFTTGAQAVVKFIKENKGIVVITAGVAVGITAVGAALVAAGVGLSLAGAAIGGIMTIFGALSAVIGAVGLPIAAVIAGVAVLGAALTAAAGAWLYYSGQGGKALKWFGERFGNVKDTALTAWGGIRDAMEAGDLALAAKVAWAGVRAAVLSNTIELQRDWVEFTTFFEEYWAAFTAMWKASWASIELAVIPVVQSLISMWGAFADSISAVVGYMREGFTAVFDFLPEGLQGALKACGEQIDGFLSATEKKLLPFAAALGTLAPTLAPVLTGAYDVTTSPEKRAEIQAGLGEARDQAGKDLGNAPGEFQDKIAKAEAERLRRLQEANDGWKVAVKELADARAAAAEAAENARNKAAQGGPGGMPSPVEVEDMARQKVDVKGTFNASVLGELGSDKLSDVAKATKDTAANTKRIADQMSGTGGAIGPKFR